MSSNAIIMLEEDTLVDIMEIIDLSQNFDEERKQRAIEKTSAVLISRILKLLNEQNYQALLPVTLQELVVKKLEEFHHMVNTIMTEFTCPLLNEFSHKPIRIRKTRVVFDREAFLSFFRENVQKSEGKRFVVCPVTGTDLVHPIRHQSRQLSAKLQVFCEELESKTNRIFELVNYFFEQCHPVDKVSDLERLISQVSNCYEIVIRNPTIAFLTQKISLIQYINRLHETIGEEGDSPFGGTEEERNRSLVLSLFQLGNIHHKQKDHDRCIRYLEEELLDKEQVRKYLTPEQVRRTIELLMISYREIAVSRINENERTVENRESMKYVEYMFEFASKLGPQDVDEDEDFRSVVFSLYKDGIKEFPQIDLVFDKILAFLDTSDENVKEKGFEILKILNEQEERIRERSSEEEREEMKIKLITRSLHVLKKLKSFDENNVDVNMRLKDVYLDLGEAEEAMKIIMFLVSIAQNEEEKARLLEEAVRIDPSNSEIAEFVIKDAIRKRDTRKILEVTDHNNIASGDETAVRRVMDLRTDALCQIIDTLRVGNERNLRASQIENDELKGRLQEVEGKYEEMKRKYEVEAQKEMKKKMKQFDKIVERNQKLERKITSFSSDMEQMRQLFTNPLKKLKSTEKKVEQHLSREKPSPGSGPSHPTKKAQPPAIPKPSPKAGGGRDSNRSSRDRRTDEKEEKSRENRRMPDSGEASYGGTAPPNPPRRSGYGSGGGQSRGDRSGGGGYERKRDSRDGGGYKKYVRDGGSGRYDDGERYKRDSRGGGGGGGRWNKGGGGGGRRKRYDDY